MPKTRKKTLIIGGLLTLVLIMAVGYAAFATQLNINGTSNITSNWDIEIVGITADKEATNSGTAQNPNYTTPGNISATYDTLSAAFSAALISPSDSVTYTITVENKGNIDAKLSTIEKTPSTNSAIIIKENGIYEGEALAASETKQFTVTVSYSDAVTSQPSNVNASFTLNLTYEQEDGSGRTFDDPDNADSALEKLDITTANMSSKGLAIDTTDTGRYYYKGANPNNYITFNGENAGWRIVSIETDGTIKIVRNTSIGSMSWDATENRDAVASTYCINAATYGCSAWAKTNSLSSIVNQFSTQLGSGTYIQYEPVGGTSGTSYSGTVTKDASLNTFLNTTYYNNPESNASYLNATSRSQIVSHDFKVSSPGNWTDTESVSLDTTQEGYYTWNGYVGLINVTDYMRATSNNTCTSLKVGDDNTANSATNCGTNNWLKNGTLYWTISPLVHSGRRYVWYVTVGGSLNYYFVSDTYGVRPAVYLSSNISLQGSGTSGDPYTIQ